MNNNRSLITRFGGIGDIVLLTPALKALTERDGNPPDLVTGAGWVYPTLKLCPYVNDIFVLSKRGLPYLVNRSSWHLKKALKHRNYNNSYNLHPEPRTQRHFNYLTLSPLTEFAGSGVEHEASRRLRELGFAQQTPYQTLTPELYTSTPDIERLQAKDPVYSAPFILIQPGNKKTMTGGDSSRSSNTKHWSNDQWQHVIRSASQSYPEATILVIGSPSESTYIDTIIAPIKSKQIRNYTKELNLLELKAASCLAAGMITVDTGPAHIAAAFGCPMIELFGPCITESHAPLNLGQPMNMLVKFENEEEKARHHSSIGLITADEVIEKFHSTFDFNRSLPESRII